MGRGSRHSKNAGGMGTETLTYHERRALGHGTAKQRLGKDSQGNYNDCMLTLQPVVSGVVTKHGYLFSREAILDYYLTQLKEKKKEMAAWEADQARKVLEAQEKGDLMQEAKIIVFERQNNALSSTSTTAAILKEYDDRAKHMHDKSRTVSSGHSIQHNEDRARSVKSFWQPQDTPTADIGVAKPSMEILCPASGKKLNMKSLIDVKFHRAPDDTDGLHVDPISNDVLTNHGQLVVLAPTGDVILEKTYRQCIKPDGEYDGKRIREKDVIPLLTGGSGFAGRDGEKLTSSKHFSLGAGSGKADMRGQNASAASRFGLSFQN